MGDLIQTIVNGVFGLIGTISIGYLVFRKDRKGQQIEAEDAEKDRNDTALGKAAEIALQAVEPYQQIVAEQARQLKDNTTTLANATAELKMLREENASIIHNLQTIVQSLVDLVNNMESGKAIDPQKKAELLATATEAVSGLKKVSG